MAERGELYRIRQEPDEPYQDFISRLLQVVCGLMVDGEAGVNSAKHLVYENANATCQAASCPLRKKEKLMTHASLCADTGPARVNSGYSPPRADGASTVPNICGYCFKES